VSMGVVVNSYTIGSFEFLFQCRRRINQNVSKPGPEKFIKIKFNASFNRIILYN
jgi:hypothetical protein